MNFAVAAIVINVVWAFVAWNINRDWSKHCKEIEAEMYTWKARALMRGEEDG